MLDRLSSLLGDDTLGLDVWIALALGLLIAVLFIRAFANQVRIPKLRPIHSAAAADCMVVIPARNEEGFVGRAAASLPHDSVIVVDDSSDDRTAEEAEKNGAGVMKAGTVSRGSYGKSNACIVGARALTSRWILFADADTHYTPEFLTAAIACAEASGIAFLSIYLEQEYGNLPEYCLAPYLTALFFCGTNPLTDPPGAFNGQCILVRRDAYTFLGGHAAVITHLNEDVRLAMLAHRHRLTFGIVRAKDLGFVRIHDLSGMVRRGACRFMIGSPVGGIAIVIAALAMAAWPFLTVWRWHGRMGNAWRLPQSRIYASSDAVALVDRSRRRHGGVEGRNGWLRRNTHKHESRFCFARFVFMLATALGSALWWLINAHQPRLAIAFAALPFLLLWRWYARGWGTLAAITLPISIYAVLPMLLRGLWTALAGGTAEWKGRM